MVKCYNHLGPSEKMRLLCFFDAGFSARLDGSSQGGYIIMMIMHSAEEGEYHILDWRSFKTPRVSGLLWELKLKQEAKQVMQLILLVAIGITSCP